ncbi:MAG: terminase small subunit [Bacteroidales bacterium]|nr:terminase small subunit [Bacteroidales bacterium]
MALSVRQEKFCLEYAKSGNATEAYKLAGYQPKSEKAAGASAARMLGNVSVQARLQELQQEMATPKIADAKEIQEGLTALFRTAIDNGDAFAATKTAEIINKMQGAYVSKVELSGNVGIADALKAAMGRVKPDDS